MIRPGYVPLALALLLAPPGLTAQTVEDFFPVASTADSIPLEPLPIDSAVTIGTLPNGVRYYIRHNAEPAARAELRLVVRAGSLQEDDDQQGLAHFLEHMAFNGTRNFAEQELIDYLGSIGMRFGADLNASTTFDHTLYRLTVPTDSDQPLLTAFQILQDWADGITLDRREVEAEQGVVLAEWRSRLGAGSRVRSQTDSLMYGASRYLERKPIGHPESIESASREKLLRFYEDWYRPELMAVVVVGDVDEQRTQQLIHEHFTQLSGPEDPRAHVDYELPTHDDVRVAVVTDPELTSASVELVQKIEPAAINSVERHRDAIAQSLFAGILNERLRVIATGANAPFLSAGTRFGSYIGGMDTHAIIGVRVNDEAILESFQAALTEVERIAQHGVSELELEREKRSAQSRYRQTLIRVADITSAQHADAYVSHFLTGRTPASIESNVALSEALLQQITADEVAAHARRWKDRRNLVLVAALPEKEGLVTPTEAELRAVLDEVDATILPVEPVRQGHDAPVALLPERPTPGAVVEARRIPEVGVTEWRLANGARVLLKPTDFSRDQILFTAYGWGGSSVIADEDLVDATLARTLPSVTGLGEYSPADLRNAVVGKLISVGMNISTYTQSVSGQSTRRDLESFLELAHLHFTSPRLDEDAVESWKHRTRTSIAGRSANPEVRFADTLRVVMTQRHPRRRALTEAEIDAIDQKRALEIYRERFADAAAFTFVLVGDFDPDSIQPLVETYIGGLPARAGGAGWRDTGVRAPEGVVEKEFRFGQEPRARIAILFNGPFAGSMHDQIGLRATASVLESRLRDRLREALGGTYSVHVHTQVQTIPDPSYQVHIGFDAGVNQTESMAAAVFEEVQRLRAGGPTEEEVSEVREEYTRQLELSLENNSFWLQMIRSYDQLDRSLSELARYGDFFAEIDADVIHDMSRQYLDPARFVKVTQLPAL